MGFTSFYFVLLGFTGFYRVLLGFYRVLPSFTGFYWVLLGFTGFYWVLPGFTGFYRVVKGNGAVAYRRAPLQRRQGRPERRLGFPLADASRSVFTGFLPGLASGFASGRRGFPATVNRSFRNAF